MAPYPETEQYANSFERIERGYNNMEIRPHHALCAHFFVGKGYSEQFVEHMIKTLAALNCDGAVVTLTNKCDELCKQCPNNRNGACESDDKVRAIDIRAIEAMRLHFGETVLWSDLYSLAEHRVLEPGMLKEVCGDCEWIDLCKNTDSVKRK